MDFYTSHEALVLHYEQAQTRQVPRQWGWFNLSTHFPWIGMRTADSTEHMSSTFRGIRNPVAVKIGPSVKPDQLKRLVATLNPDNEPGRLTLAAPDGCFEKIEQHLPPLVEAVSRRRCARAVELRSDARKHRGYLVGYQDAPLRNHP